MHAGVWSILERAGAQLSIAVEMAVPATSYNYEPRPAVAVGDGTRTPW